MTESQATNRQHVKRAACGQRLRAVFLYRRSDMERYSHKGKRIEIRVIYHAILRVLLSLCSKRDRFRFFTARVKPSAVEGGLLT
jgi:hypothetical protein